MLGLSCDAAHPELVAAFKKPRGGAVLSAAQRAFNKVQAWYRVTVEHSIGYIKRFRIMSTTHRGRVTASTGYLMRAVHIVMCMSTIKMNRVPHRVHPVVPGVPNFVYPVRFLLRFRLRCLLRLSPRS